MSKDSEQPKEDITKPMTNLDILEMKHGLNKAIEQPNSNAMIFEQINGCAEMIINLLEKLTPKTENVESCIITHKAWQNNNLKHLQKAYE